MPAPGPRYRGGSASRRDGSTRRARRPASRIDAHMVEERLHRATDIRRVIGEGARAHGTFVVVHALRRGSTGPARWTVVAGRKVGSAVRRNRAKRRLRALLQRQSLPYGHDVVVVARAAAVHADAAVLADELAGLVRKVSAVAAVGGR